MQKFIAKTAVIPAALGLVFLFVGNVNHFDNRLIKEAWQTGHFFLFFCLAYIALQLPVISRQSVQRQFWIIVLLSITVGLITEVLQYVIGRSFQLVDLIADLLGGIGGYLLVRIHQSPKWTSKFAIAVLLVVISIIGLHRFLANAIDEWYLNQSVPILANFETPFELTRWVEGGTQNSITDKFSREGQRALQVDFKPAKWPHAILRRFYQDWSAYNTLAFSVYNPYASTEKMFIGIQDGSHWGVSYGYHKRFNQTLNLNPGWNDFSISTEAIRKGPRDRIIQLNNMVSIIFVVESPQAIKTFYIDHIRLAKNNTRNEK